MEDKIKLVQKPVIQHKLAEVGASVTARIKELNLDKLVATDETIQSMKTLRADLNKELKDFEEQRKTLKEAVANPYMEFESVYKVEISEKYKSAIDTLKDKIGAFELKVKEEKKATVELYFVELCQDAGIDFLKFEHTGLDINLSTSLKQYKEKCAEFVNRVQDDLILIKGEEMAAEALVEYKSNGLNASKAISIVRERAEKKRLETQRLKTEETNRRTKMLTSMSMVYHDMTMTYNYVQDESIFIELAEIENLKPEDFNKKYVEIESKIKAKQADLFSQQNTTAAETSSPAPAPKPEEPILKAPEEVKQPEPEKTFKAKFECEGTMIQLKALGLYMKENGITYKNL